MTMACTASAAFPKIQDLPLLQFSVPTVHCAACIGKIEKALTLQNDVSSARVNLSLKRLSVTGEITSASILSTLRELGFEAYPLDNSALSHQNGDPSKRLLLRVAVAGFAMMNVMLLSVAVWSGAQHATRDLFHLISAAIALPAVMFSAQPFFQNAWSALRMRRLNMDVPISLAILLALGMSLFETLHGGGHAYFDAALSLTFFLLIGRYLDLRTRQAARSAAKELAALEVQTAQRMDNNHATTVSLEEVRVGDTLMVSSGSRVPVDGVLMAKSALLDRSFLTGESEPIQRGHGATVQAGEINIGGPIPICATAIGQDTTLRRIAAMVETAENGRNTYTALADRAAQIYAPGVHLLAAFAFLGWMTMTGDVRVALNVAIAVLIITCPCALGLAVPAVSTAAISRLFGAGLLVKHATALERLADVNYVVFDKTGTLTRPALADANSLNTAQKSVALALAQASKHPMSQAIVRGLEGVSPATLTAVHEHASAGVSARWNGAPVLMGHGEWLDANFDGLGLKIGTQTAVPLVTSEILRRGVAEAVKDIKLPAEVLTGDSTEPAQHIAQQIGLPFHAKMSPQKKLKRLNLLRDQGFNVLMIGDGLNDTAALAAAHASIAPASSLEAARSAADLVILKENLSNVPIALHVARMARHLSKQNFAIAAVYNCIAVPIALAGAATPLLAAVAMVVSSITVILNAQRMRYL